MYFHYFFLLLIVFFYSFFINRVTFTYSFHFVSKLLSQWVAEAIQKLFFSLVPFISDRSRIHFLRFIIHLRLIFRSTFMSSSCKFFSFLLLFFPFSSPSYSASFDLSSFSLFFSFLPHSFHLFLCKHLGSIVTSS